MKGTDAMGHDTQDTPKHANVSTRHILPFVMFRAVCIRCMLSTFGEELARLAGVRSDKAGGQRWAALSAGGHEGL